MIVGNDKFAIDIDNLKQSQDMVLRAIYREGEKHLKYFASTMTAFKNPKNRVVTHDTVYYQEVMPIIIAILRERENKANDNEC